MMNGICGIEFISPLQGFHGDYKLRWTMSIAKIVSAFSAVNALCNYVPEECHISMQDNVLYTSMKYTHALKGLNIKEQDIVLFNYTIT